MKLDPGITPVLIREVNVQDIFVGCSLSDANRADIPNGLRVPERLADYAHRFQESVGTSDFPFELDPEDHWTIPSEFPDRFVASKTNRWWRAFRNNANLLELYRNAVGPIGIHQPIRGNNILSSNFFLKYHGIAETQQAMQFAQYIGADYFLFHLTMADNWGWDRHDQIAKALKIFQVFAAYYHANRMTFVPCIEMLQYPQFPETGGGAVELLARARELWPETMLAFDISHLWGTRNRMMAARLWESKNGIPVPFVEALEYGLEQTCDDIYVMHLGGCWETETHAVPGLHPQQDPFRYPIKLRESPSVYAEMGEIDLNRTLDLLLNYTIRKDRPLRLVLKIYDRDFAQILEATRQIRTELLMRAAEPAPKLSAPQATIQKARPLKKATTQHAKRKPKSPATQKANRQVQASRGTRR